MEDEAERLVRLGVALAAGEHVLLDVLEHGEPRAARRVRDDLAGRARRALLDDRGWREMRVSRCAGTAQRRSAYTW